MKPKIATALGTLRAAAAAAMPPGSAAAAERTVTVKFAPGATSRTVSGNIKGYDGVNYRLGAGKGQVMQVLFCLSNRSCYFNVLPPGGSEAVFNGSASGNEFGANLTQGGNYTVQVDLMRNAARRNETCNYSITF